MSRRKGPDPLKIKKILEVLEENPRGLWSREIARQSGLSTTTTHRYLNEYLDDKVEEIIRVKGTLVRFIKLKR